MTDEEINIAIAEACGWKVSGKTLLVCQKPKIRGWMYLPNYCSNLNATHEAEKVLMEQGSWVTYSEYLGWKGVAPDRRILHATARQRAEAFLKTLGLWKEQTTED